MLSNSQIKYLRSLQVKKYRLAHGEFVTEGLKLVSDLLTSDLAISNIYATKVIADNFDFGAIELTVVDDKTMKKISSLKNPPGILATAKQPQVELSEYDLDSGWTVLLSGINDPGNLGTIIRTCEWFGINQLICDFDTVDVYNPKVIQSAMGAVGRVMVVYSDLSALLKNKKGIEIFSTALVGSAIDTINFPTQGLLLFGSESHGLSDELLELSTKQVFIPRHKHGEGESLNVAISLGIVLSKINAAAGS